jgi:hypothetical protein
LTGQRAWNAFTLHDLDFAFTPLANSNLLKVGLDLGEKSADGDKSVFDVAASQESN